MRIWLNNRGREGQGRRQGDTLDVPSGQTCGVCCPCGKAPGMASVSKWLPKPDWYCKGRRLETASSAWEGAVVVVPPEEEEEEAMLRCDVEQTAEGAASVISAKGGASSGTCPGRLGREGRALACDA